MDISDFIRPPTEESQAIEEVSLKQEKDPWQFIHAIRNGKHILTEENENQYTPFLTNRSLTQSIDTALYAQEMNQRYALPKSLQFDYLFYAIKKYKRPYSKWLKKDKDADVELIQKYYGYNINRAREILGLHTQEQLDEIKYSMRIGGTNEKKSRKAT